jgi:uncharacterized phage protein (TIGR02218 family)
MSAPLQFFEVTSWDFMSAATVTDRLDQDNVAQWTGSVGSMQTGYNSVGQCIRAPSALHRKFKADRFDTVYARFYFRTSSAASGQVIVDARNSGGTLCFFGVDLFGNLIVDSGFNTWTSSHAGLADNTWYQVEFMVRIDATDGAFEVRLDGVPIEDLIESGVDTTGVGGLPDRVAFDNSVGDFDHFTGKVGFGGWTDSDWIGRVDGYPHIVTLYPDSNGEWDDWSIGAGSGALWEVVNETPANTSDYISTNVAGARVSFRLDDLPSEIDEVFYVKVAAYSRGTGAQTMRHFHGYHGGLVEIRHRGVNSTMNSTWTFREREWPRNERGGNQWVKESFPGLDVGYQRITAASAALDISQIAVEVLWAGVDESDVQYPAPTLLRGGTHRLAKCWRITRRDGRVMRFASHDQPLTIAGKVYEAIGGIAATASRAESELKDKNQDFVGLLSSDAITDDDLRAGRYRNAMVEEFCVNWELPEFGRHYLNRFWVGDTKWNGVTWEASVNGHARFLKQKIGGVWGRMCRYHFGEPKCFYALHGETYRAVKVASVVDPRRKFRADTADITTTLANNHFAHGRLTWRSGPNYAIESYVRKYTHSTREFELAEKVPFDITDEHYFDVSQGCDGLFSSCQAKDNKDNFGGEPHIPGTDKALSTPDQ